MPIRRRRGPFVVPGQVGMDISGAELRRREEPRPAAKHGEPIPAPPFRRVHSPTREDFEHLPPPTAWCLACGAGVLFYLGGGLDRPLDRDGGLHYDTCDPPRVLPSFDPEPEERPWQF
jgi:hypothetical protein